MMRYPQLQPNDMTVHITLTRNPDNGLWLAKTDNFLYGSPGSPYYAVKTLLDQLPPVKDDQRILVNTILIAVCAFIAMVSLIILVFVWPVYQLIWPLMVVLVSSVVVMTWAAVR